MAFDQFDFGFGGGSPLTFTDARGTQAPSAAGGSGGNWLTNVLSAASNAYTNYLVSESQSNAAKYGYQVGAAPGTTADVRVAQAGVGAGSGLITAMPAAINPQIVYAVLAAVVLIALVVVFKKK